MAVAVGALMGLRGEMDTTIGFPIIVFNNGESDGGCMVNGGHGMRQGWASGVIIVIVSVDDIGERNGSDRRDPHVIMEGYTKVGRGF